MRLGLFAMKEIRDRIIKVSGWKTEFIDENNLPEWYLVYEEFYSKLSQHDEKYKHLDFLIEPSKLSREERLKLHEECETEEHERNKICNKYWDKMLSLYNKYKQEHPEEFTDDESKS